jgi:voltage-gated potassium channel Kch
MRAKCVVIDYNPKVILSLGDKGIDCIYGDAGDRDFLSQLNLEKVKLIISTIPDEASNLTIKERLKDIHSKAIFIATAEQPRQALDLYAQDIDYVIVPHHLGGDLISTIIQAFKTDKQKYLKLGKDHRKMLKRAKDSSTFS